MLNIGINMGGITSHLTPGQSGVLPSKAAPDDKITKAAAQFESLFLAQMLKSAHTSVGGLGGEDDESNQTMMEIAQEQIAQALADSGGLGLGKTIADSLRTQAPDRAPSKLAPISR